MAHGSYIDTLAEKSPDMGAYVYCANNPVKLVDPDGNSPIISEELINCLNLPQVCY